MQKLVLALFFLILIATPLAFLDAQENLSGGQGSNLVIKVGSLKVKKEDLAIRLHVGFAEVSQTYILENEKNAAQKVALGFAYRQGRERSLDNIKISINDQPVNTVSTKETADQTITHWQSFETDFQVKEAKTIKISHWQMNGANFRGLRTFKYVIKNRLPGEIGNLNISLNLMDGITLKNFDKTTNQDFDLRIEPAGWKSTSLDSNNIYWQWQNFKPGFDLMANFYWPDADLARIGNLNQNLGLYSISATNNQENANNLVDSSYLTAWQADNSLAQDNVIRIDFKNKIKLENFSIIAGRTGSNEEYLKWARPQKLLLTFDNNQQKEIDLTDNLALQTFNFNEPVETTRASISIKSVYPGTTKIGDKTSISELMFDTKIDKPVVFQDVKTEKKSFWLALLNFWQTLTTWVKIIFR